MQVFACLAALVVAVSAGGNSNLKCGSAIYAPAIETCCGDRVVPRSRTDLLCCMGNTVNNQDGRQECCGIRGFNRAAGDRCVNGEVFAYVARTKEVVAQPRPLLARLGLHSTQVSYQKAPFQGAVVDGHRKVAAKITKGYPQHVQSKQITGMDTLECRGKIHRLTDPSQFGFFACCGTEVYEWRYYTCVNDKITQIEDAPWPTVVPNYGYAFGGHAAARPVIRHTAARSYAAPRDYAPRDSYAAYGNARDTRYTAPRAYGYGRTGYYDAHHSSAYFVTCGSQYYQISDNQAAGYECCGGDLIDSKQFDCSPYQGTPPRRVDGSTYGKKSFPLASYGAIGKTASVTPYCTNNQVVGDAEAYGCCSNALYDQRSHFCCGTTASEKKAGQLCCDGALADNTDGYTSCCGSQAYDIRVQTCDRDPHNY